jgi:hypothetical protein
MCTRSLIVNSLVNSQRASNAAAACISCSFSASRAFDKYIYENISLYDKGMAQGGPECLYNVRKTLSESGRPEPDTIRVAKLSFTIWQFEIIIIIIIIKKPHNRRHRTVAVFAILLSQNVHEKLLACQRTTSVLTCTRLILNEIVQYYEGDKQTDGHANITSYDSLSRKLGYNNVKPGTRKFS